MMPQRSPKRRRRRRISSHTAAATPATAAVPMSSPVSLPDELIFDILSRLPIKSVCRCRCVCRGWHALISDPPFVTAHRCHAEPLVVAATFSRATGFNLRLMDMDGNLVRVIKDVIGFRLLSTSTTDFICVTKGECAQVIDPATGNILLNLPEQLVGLYKKQCQDIFGFGRAVPSGRYKMVRVRNDMDCNVITLGDDIRWRLARLPPVYVSRDRGSPVVCNGVMYFLVSWKQHNDTLLRLDLESEEWMKTIEGPQKIVGPELWKRTVVVNISELNSTLCVVQLEIRATNIWLLTDSDKIIWIKKYTIPTVFPTFSCMPLRVTRDERLIFYSTSEGQDKTIQVYDPRNKTCVALPRFDTDAITISLCSLHLDRFVSAKF